MPSWLADWGSAAGLYDFVRRYRDGAAALTVLILATIPFFYGGAQFANLDMLVAGLVTLCVLAAVDTVLRAPCGRERGLQAAGLWRNAQNRLAAKVANARPIRIRASNRS